MGRRSFGWTTLVIPLLFVEPAWAEGSKKECLDAHVKGQDLRRDGHLSAAREALRACAASTCPAIVRDDCTKRLDEAERAQPTVIFEARDGAGNDLADVKVTMVLHGVHRIRQEHDLRQHRFPLLPPMSSSLRPASPTTPSQQTRRRAR
jgi:hypothetical protein